MESKERNININIVIDSDSKNCYINKKLEEYVANLILKGIVKRDTQNGVSRS